MTLLNHSGHWPLKCCMFAVLSGAGHPLIGKASKFRKPTILAFVPSSLGTLLAGCSVCARDEGSDVINAGKLAQCMDEWRCVSARS